MLRHPLSELPALKVATSDLVRYRDDRLVEVSSETVRQDLALLGRFLMLPGVNGGTRSCATRSMTSPSRHRPSLALERFT